MRVVILGNDALLAARPARPLQLVRACQRAGFSLVAPVSWGEELLAMRVAERVRRRAERAVVIAHCPCVADAMRSAPAGPAGFVTAVSPPRATARYVRAALAGHAVHVAYVGDCPGAHHGGDIDAVFSPQVFLGRLHEAGIILDDLPPHVEEQLPPERARHASIPGGAPEAAWLAATAGATIREAAPATLAAVLATAGEDPLVLDLASASGCACARNRFAVARLEPARSASAVLRADGLLDLADPNLELELAAHRARAPSGGSVSSLVGDAAAPTATDARDLAQAGVALAPPAASRLAGGDVAYHLTTSVEPWVRVAGHRAPPRSATPRDPAGGAAEAARTTDVPMAQAATGEASVDSPAPGVLGGSRSAAHPRQPGVRPRSLSPVPPVISPALRSVMDVLEAQERDARRKAVRRYGVLGAVVAVVSLAALALFPGASRAKDRAWPTAPALVESPTTVHDSTGASLAPSAASAATAPVRDSLRDRARHQMSEPGASTTPALPDRP